MKRENTPATAISERTVYRLTEEEVIQALVAFVGSNGETVPAGQRFVWTRRDHSHALDQDGWFATLGVDHEAKT